ncbi:MAG: LPS export ABC transporter periplasmic protein LptC [Nitrospirae bacterium]|nr:LPS export ABC transporter periplasmic protein LptC [Nitrospirota bacterium]
MWQRWVRGGLLALVVALASFLVYLLVTRTESVPPPSSASPGPNGRADAGIDQFKFTQSRDGAVQWEVQAQRAHVFEAENRAMLEQVQVTLHGAKGWELKLAGDEGSVDLAKKDFVLVNRVEPITIQLESGYTITTNHLMWADEAHEIMTRDPVTITGNGLVLKGTGLVGKLGIEEFQIEKDVNVEIAQ